MTDRPRPSEASTGSTLPRILRSRRVVSSNLTDPQAMLDLARGYHPEVEARKRQREKQQKTGGESQSSFRMITGSGPQVEIAS